MNILQVLSDLKHNGTLHKAGTFLEAEAGQFEDLVKQGILKVIEGAENVEEAAKIVLADAQKTAAVAAEASKEAENTWGPKADPIVAPEAEAAKSGNEQKVETAVDTTTVTKPEAEAAKNTGSGEVDLSAGL